MKRIFLIIISFIIAISSISCMFVKYNFTYEYEDLRNNLVRAELIYLDEELDVFILHSPASINEFDHTVIRAFSEDEFDDLIKSIVDLPFRYAHLYIITGGSVVYSIDGYVIALYYGRDTRILIGRNAEHRQNTTHRLNQVQTGRYVNDNIWNNFIDNVLAYNSDPTH